MSLEARMLFILMVSYRDDWVFNVNHLRAKLGIGRDRMRKASAELQGLGHLIRCSMRDKGTGTLCGTQWVLIDDPENYAQRIAAGERIRVAGMPDGVFLDPADMGDDSAESSADAPGFSIDLPGVPVAAMRRETDDGGEKTAKSPANHRGPEIQAVGGRAPRKRPEIVEFGHRGPENPTVGESGPIRRTIYKKDSPLPPNAQTATASAPGDPIPSAPRSAHGRGSESGRERQRQARTSRQPKKEAGETAKPLTVARVDEDALAHQWAPIVRRRLAYAATAIRRATAQRMIDLALASPAELRALGVAF